MVHFIWFKLQRSADSLTCCTWSLIFALSLFNFSNPLHTVCLGFLMFFFFYRHTDDVCLEIFFFLLFQVLTDPQHKVSARGNVEVPQINKKNNSAYWTLKRKFTFPLLPVYLCSGKTLFLHSGNHHRTGELFLSLWWKLEEYFCYLVTGWLSCQDKDNRMYFYVSSCDTSSNISA